MQTMMEMHLVVVSINIKCLRVSWLADLVMAEKICMRSSQGKTLPTWHQRM